ncbi:MAG: glycoside hydrolase family 13 protein [Peptococcaceae bacterium]
MYTDWVIHDSHDLYYRTPFGAVPCNQEIRLKIVVMKPVDKVILRLWKGTEEEQIAMYLNEISGNKRIYQIRLKAPAAPLQLWYFFILYLDGKKYYYGNSTDYGGRGATQEWEPPSYQITVYKEGASTPHWFKESIMYQIFVDRFYNGHEGQKILNKKANKYVYHYPAWEENIKPYRVNEKTGEIRGFDIYGGNLAGIIKKLSYLRDLGITVLYLNPIFEAPSNHKYDTADYQKVDSIFGDNETFQILAAKANEMGIKIILDGVFSHTGSDSIYFNKEGTYDNIGAYQSEESPYYSWYSFQKHCDEYHCWWGIDTLPNVNEMDPCYRDFIITADNSIIKYWLKMGAKGWRLDVADELPDEFIKEIHREMKNLDPDSVLIGEVWEDASRKVSYHKIREYLLGEELDSVMNYPFRQILLDFFTGRKHASEATLALLSIKENYPLHNFYANMNILGTHDVPRILTVLGGIPEDILIKYGHDTNLELTLSQRMLAKQRLKLLTLIQMTFPGVPCIYYGDEVGMEGYQDPFNRGTYPWGHEDQEILNWYKKIISLRNKYDVFKTGEWLPLTVQNDDVFGYVRTIRNNKNVFMQEQENNLAILLVNRSVRKTMEIKVNLSEYVAKCKLFNLLEANHSLTVEDGLLQMKVEPLQGKLFIKKLSDKL